MQVGRFPGLATQIFHLHYSRAKAEKDPKSVSIKYSYAASTATGNLRKHLQKNHEAEYTETMIEKGWKPPSLRASQLASSTGSTGATGKLPAPQYSVEAFIEKLVKFVVVDDQVKVSHLKLYNKLIKSPYQAINVIECPEFRDLLSILHPDLEIPGRTKLRTCIITAWRDWFDLLKEELAVCAIYYTLPVSYLFSRHQLVRSVVPLTYGQIGTVIPSLPLPLTGWL